MWHNNNEAMQIWGPAIKAETGSQGEDSDTYSKSSWMTQMFNNEVWNYYELLEITAGY